jgi:hypothetical protein
VAEGAQAPSLKQQEIVMSSKLDICNMALGMVSAHPIASFDENSAEAMAIHFAFKLTYDSLLSRHPWSFATKVQDLPVVDDETYDFQYVYEIPADCHKPIGIVHSFDEMPEFKVRGRKIYSNHTPMQLEYIRYVDDTGILPGYFIDALVMAIAVKIAPRLGAIKLLNPLQQQAFTLFREARAIDAGLTNKESTAHRTFVNVRR